MRAGVLIAFLFALGGCGSSGELPVHKEPELEPLPDGGSDAGDPPITEEERAKLDAYLDAQFKARGWPSGAFGIVRGDTLVYARGHNADEHTAFRIGSVTKVMTAVALLQLRDQKKVDLDDQVTKYVPELTPTGHTSVTLRHLLTHSSGIPRVGDGTAKYWTGDHDVTEAELLASIKNAPLEFTPGSRVSYSNFGMALAGLVIARVAGEPYRDVMEGSLFGPLTMTESSFEGTAKGSWLTASGYVPASTSFRLGAAEPAGGLYSTVADVARFLAFEGRAESQLGGLDSVLGRATLRESQTARPEFRPFGLAWVTGDNELGRMVTHNGSVIDHSSIVELYPERRLGVVGLLSTGNTSELTCVAHEALAMLVRDTAPAGCAPVLTSENSTAIGEVISLITTPDATRIDSAFSPAFPTSRAELLKFFQDCRTKFGACTSHETLANADDGSARVKLVCEKAGANVLIAANPESKRIETLFVAE